MERDDIRAWVNVVATLGVIVMNSLANVIPFGGQTTGEVADQYPILITPAGYVFSIWSLIYIGLIAFTIYQWRPAHRDNPRLRRVGYLYALSCVLNSVWLLAWHNDALLISVLLMLGLLGSLIAIFVRLQVGRADASTGERWFAHLPFSIYLGWISVATITNIAALLYSIGWGGWGLSDATWTVIMMAAAAALAGIMSFSRHVLAYTLVIIWALIGIAVKDTTPPAVSTAGWLLAGLALVLWVAGYVAPSGAGRRRLPA